MPNVTILINWQEVCMEQFSTSCKSDIHILFLQEISEIAGKTNHCRKNKSTRLPAKPATATAYSQVRNWTVVNNGTQVNN